MRGRQARREVPRSSHGVLGLPTDRVDPLDLLEGQAATRIAELVPVRHGRMQVSPFAYFRGAALPMAADLATTPTSGLTVQLCGDAHLSNFGIFGSPERHLFFGLNDFDESHSRAVGVGRQAPGREHRDRRPRQRLRRQVNARRSVRRAVRTYRKTMREMARMPMLDVWYAHLDMEDLLPRFRALLDPKRTPAVWHATTKARAHDSLQAFEKLCHTAARGAADRPRPAADRADRGPARAHRREGRLTRAARDPALLSPHPAADRRHLLDQYRIVHLARKVVGVGSVGTGAWIVLLLDDHDTPLFLQVKEADASVLERFTAPSPFDQHGERVVAGQRLMQAVSDIFLGWQRFDWEGDERDCYVRQLRDWKGSADVAGMTPAGLELWAPDVRLDARPRPRPLGRPRRDRRVPGQVQHLRARDHGLRRSPTPTRMSATTRRSARRSPAAVSRRDDRPLSGLG